MEEDTVSPSVEGAIKYVDGAFEFRDALGLFDPRTTGDAAGHRAYDQLVHNIAETSYLEVTRNGSGRITNVTYYTDSGKTTKIRECQVTRTFGKVSQIVVIQYNGAGAIAETLTYDTFSRTSGKLTSVEATLT